jgi:hypothetical protein
MADPQVLHPPSPQALETPVHPGAGAFRPAIHTTAKKAGTHRVPQISGIGIGSGPPQK